MFGNLFSSSSRPRRESGRFRPTLERLGGRFAPTDLAPVIVDFTYTVDEYGTAEFTGRVIDEDPAALTVAFAGGPDSLAGAYAPVAADGTFKLVAALSPDGSDQGTVYAWTMDGAWQQSNVASVDV